MFFLRKVRFPGHGHVISKDGLSPIASRKDDMGNLKTPESNTDVLGMTGFYPLHFKLSHRCKTSMI